VIAFGIDEESAGYRVSNINSLHYNVSVMFTAGR
jgi:hypothetical protein